LSVSRASGGSAFTEISANAICIRCGSPSRCDSAELGANSNIIAHATLKHLIILNILFTAHVLCNGLLS